MTARSKATITISPGNLGLPGWTAEISIPDPDCDLLATEWNEYAFTRKRVIAKAQRAIHQHYAEIALVETIEVDA